VGPRAVLDTAVKRKIPSPHRESNPDSLFHLPLRGGEKERESPYDKYLLYSYVLNSNESALRIYVDVFSVVTPYKTVAGYQRFRRTLLPPF
jgi:hypothetical protein